MAVYVPEGDLEPIRALAARLHDRARALVVTSGCFDLIHYGHVAFLQASRQLGDALLVLVSVDADIRALKGPSRPIVPGWERAHVVDAFAAVDDVVLHAADVFYELLAILRPRYFTKSSEYREHGEYLDSVRPYVGDIVLLERSAPSHSTTAIVERCRSLP